MVDSLFQFVLQNPRGICEHLFWPKHIAEIVFKEIHVVYLKSL